MDCPSTRRALALLAFAAGCATQSTHLDTALAPNVAAAPMTPAVGVEPLHDAELPRDSAGIGVLSSEQALAMTFGGVMPEVDQGEEPPRPASTTLVLFNRNTEETIELVVDRHGRTDPARKAELEDFFRCRRSGRTHDIAPGVLRVLAAVGDEFPGHVIEIISGYRASPYGVKHSKHFEGRAIDLRVRGVKLSKVRDFVWRNFTDVGVGYYGHQNFMHVDFRPEDKDTAWTSPHENAKYEFNPRWAMRIRPPWRTPAMHLEEVEHEDELALPGTSAEIASVEGTKADATL